MEKNNQRNAQLKITEKELFEELKLAVKDTFTAIIQQETDTSLRMRFVDGSQFRVSVEHLNLT